ncbi:hypothetical protein HAX54_009319, partial [Datura stramonium]|nr:hypothetical protein [Datura stramonium]
NPAAPVGHWCAAKSDPRTADEPSTLGRMPTNWYFHRLLIIEPRNTIRKVPTRRGVKAVA